LRPALALPILAALLAGTAAAETGGGTPRGPLGDSAAAVLGDAPRRATWGILAVSLDRGDTLLALDPDRRLIPGSNQKLLTNGAFLREVRPESRGRTALWARGKPKRKGPAEVRLKGDLILRGSGMPDVVPLLAPGSRGLLDSLAWLLRASGLTRFEGTLWVDGTLFASNGYPRGWAVEDIPLGYGAPVNAILANGNAASVVASAESSGAKVVFDPPDTPLGLEGVVSVGGRGDPSWLTVSRDLCGRTVRVLGVVASGQSIRRTVSVPEPDSAAGLLFLGAMRRAGIETKATVRIAGHGAPKDPTAVPEEREASAGGGAGAARDGWARVTPDKRVEVLGLPSPTARAVVSAVLAYSLNTETEALLRWLDPAPAGKSPERALAVLKLRLAAAGVDSLDVSSVDGSGLSPQDLVTPRALVRWLTAMERDSSLGGPFSALLPAPGEPGTLEHRFGGGASDRSLHAKTGTLTNVSALSGYAATGDGDRVVFSILSNGNPGSTAGARAIEDALVERIARFRRPVYGPPAPPPGIPR
jgi:D-alanyl-D-alanine carboxypeptidase/D-alanyl-D-alanine-endopeptidase (penicillin-binding protein 4)